MILLHSINTLVHGTWTRREYEKYIKILFGGCFGFAKGFIKVVEAKRILASGAIKNVNEAVRKVGISRSAYYKYKDHIFPFYETSQGKVITLFLLWKICRDSVEHYKQNCRFKSKTL